MREGFDKSNPQDSHSVVRATLGDQSVPARASVVCPP